MLYRAVRPLLFLLPPETAHGVSLFLLRIWDAMLAATRIGYWRAPATLRTHAFGKEIANPLGLAAGYDKNAEVIAGVHRLGFGFTECGTLTRRAQSGNPRPRLFRLRHGRALINRLGFNNVGAAAALARLNARAPETCVGVNIGVNADSTERVADMAAVHHEIASAADYVVFNLSSPNTPRLRELQTPEEVSDLLARTQNSPRPLFLKLAPDLSDDAVRALVFAALDGGAAGLVLANTTTARPPAAEPLTKEALQTEAASKEKGGLSGPSLYARNLELLRLCYWHSQARLTLIAAGGLETGGGAYEKLRAGANLLQIYTSLIYHGPFLPRRILRDLAKHLAADGFATSAQAVGQDAPRLRRAKVTMWYRDDCSKSRAALALLRARGHLPERTYLYDRAPTQSDLRALLARLRVPAASLWRKKEARYQTLGLADTASEEEHIRALLQNWQLIERPLVACGERAVIARPPERALEVLPANER